MSQAFVQLKKKTSFLLVQLLTQFASQKINHYKYWLKNFVDLEFKIGETI